MTDDTVLEATKQALTPLWSLPAAAVTGFYNHPVFADFRSFCERAFPTADRGLGFSFGLADALRGAGLPCLLSDTAAPSSLDEVACRIVETLEAVTVRRRYLCPLNLADILPTMYFGPASVRACSTAELDRLFDGARLARHYPGKPLDLARLADFQWLIVEEQVPVPGRAGKRAMPFYTKAGHGTSVPWNLMPALIQD